MLTKGFFCLITICVADVIAGALIGFTDVLGPQEYLEMIAGRIAFGIGIAGTLALGSAIWLTRTKKQQSENST